MSDGMPIRALSELTGVATTTLRAWERRYGLLKPARTLKGHRLYSQQDVELVRQVVALLQQGIAISEAVRQSREGAPQKNAAVTVVEHDQWSHLRQRLLHAVEGFSEAQLELVYNEALSLYPFDLVTEKLIRPTMAALGGRWAERPTGIGEEHFFSAYLRNKLGARLHHESARSHGSRLLVACLPGEYHELGALLFSLDALSRGYRVLYLGPAFPFAQLEAVAQKSQAAAIILSGTTRALDESLEEQWGQAGAITAPLFFGGHFAAEHPAWIEGIGATALGDVPTEALGRLLSTIPPYGVAAS